MKELDTIEVDAVDGESQHSFDIYENYLQITKILYFPQVILLMVTSDSQSNSWKIKDIFNK